MDHDEIRTVGFPERDQTCFTVVVAVVNPRQARALKDEGRYQQIDTVLVKIRLTFGFVPFEVQSLHP